MDIIFGIIGFILGIGIAKSNSTDPAKIEESLREENNRLIEDISYYKNLCKSISDENIELRRKQK
jgi:hypothetical protein